MTSIWKFVVQPCDRVGGESAAHDLCRDRIAAQRAREISAAQRQCGIWGDGATPVAYITRYVARVRAVEAWARESRARVARLSTGDAYAALELDWLFYGAVGAC